MIRPRRVASSVCTVSCDMVPCRSPPALPALPRQIHVQSCDGVPLPPRVLFWGGLAALDARGRQAPGGQVDGALLLFLLWCVGRERARVCRRSPSRFWGRRGVGPQARRPAPVSLKLKITCPARRLSPWPAAPVVAIKLKITDPFQRSSPWRCTGSGSTRPRVRRSTRAARDYLINAPTCRSSTTRPSKQSPLSQHHK